MFEGRNILVTGGAGFIGSHLVERLVALGGNVTSAGHHSSTGLSNLKAALDRITIYEIDFVTADVDKLIREGKFDLVFNLVASAHVQTSVENPKQDFEGNALTTLKLLQAIRSISHDTPMVHASSAMVYRSSDSGLITEDHPLGPVSPYGVSKLAAELYVSVFAHLYGLHTAVARMFPVFGPRLRKHVMFDIVGRLRRDGSVLPMLGDGTQVRDFSYVGDVVDALLLIAERGPMVGEAYNVASGEHVTVDALARLIAQTMGLAPRLEYSGAMKSGDTARLFADTGRLKKLGYAPAVGLADGIRNTVEWILRNEPIEGHSTINQLDAIQRSAKP